MTITNTKTGSSMTIALNGRLDSMTAPELDALLKDALDGVTELILDFADLEYISSAGLRILLRTQRKMDAVGTMIVKNVNADISEIFEITGFEDILTIQ